MKEMKAVSIIVLILLILCSTIIGALVSYMWVMSNFYYEAEGTNLFITEALFPVDHADYFNLTVMNPSHSPNTNITSIYFTVEENTTAQVVTRTSPEELPITLESATSKTIKCEKSWAEYSGKSITVHVSTVDDTGPSRTVETSFVKIELQTDMNPTVNSKRFNITVTNHAGSALNLTVSKVSIGEDIPEIISPTLPANLPINESISIECKYDLETVEKPVIRVDTTEGYYAELATNWAPNMNWFISNIAFNKANSTDMNITITNSESSNMYVNVSSIAMTVDSETSYIDGNLTNPVFFPYYTLQPGEKVAFSHCFWNWTSIRDQNVTIKVGCVQGFTQASRTVKTPAAVIFETTTLDFNITNTEHFTINITNAGSSLEEINVTEIKLNDNVTSFAPQIVLAGEEKTFDCSFNWTSLKGTTATVNINTSKSLQFSKTIALPSVDLQISDAIAFNSTTEGAQYVNITITNTAFSVENVTITEITFAVVNSTDFINGNTSIPRFAPDGYTLIVGSNVTMLCIWNWPDYATQTLTVTVQTAEGFSVIKTFQIP